MIKERLRPLWLRLRVGSMATPLEVARRWKVEPTGDGRRRGSHRECARLVATLAGKSQRATNVLFPKRWHTAARGRYAGVLHPLTIAGPDWFGRHSKASPSSIGRMRERLLRRLRFRRYLNRCRDRARN